MTMRVPREGFYLPMGRWLLHLNWSRSWDGWGRSDGERQETWLLKVWLTKAANKRVLSVAAWRLLIRLGTVA